DENAAAGIVIKQGNLALQKKDGEWSMSEPEAYPVSSYTGDSWVRSFAQLLQEGVLDENPTDLAPYGLSNPEQEFTLSVEDGSSITVQVGSPLPIVGHHYVKLKDAPAVYKVAD